MAEDAHAARPEGEAKTDDLKARLRDEILADPALVLDDLDVMRTLVEATGVPGGRKVVDLRGALVSRLEQRLDRLESTHRSVIAAAYDNLAGTSQIHNATLALLDQNRLVDVLRVLTLETPDSLAVEHIRICIETDEAAPGPMQGLEPDLAETVVIIPPGGVGAYLALSGDQNRKVRLRRTPPEADAIFGRAADAIRSEALVRLDLGDGRRGLLAFGAEDPERFAPEHGVDLLTFFGGVAERTLRRWLSPAT